MKSKGIATDVAHVSNLRYTVFDQFKDNNLKNLEYFDSRLMNIPCGWWVSYQDLIKITNAVNAYKG